MTKITKKLTKHFENRSEITCFIFIEPPQKKKKKMHVKKQNMMKLFK